MGATRRLMTGHALRNGRIRHAARHEPLVPKPQAIHPPATCSEINVPRSGAVRVFRDDRRHDHERCRDATGRHERAGRLRARLDPAHRTSRCSTTRSRPPAARTGGSSATSAPGRSATARRGGRPSVVTREKLAAAIAMRKDPNMTMDQIAKALKISRSALYRQLGPALEQERAEQTQQAA